MDSIKRRELIARMGETSSYNGGVAANVIALVSVETYFDGSGDMAGLLCNNGADLDSHQIQANLHTILKRADVHAVWIAVENCDDNDWPFADKIVLVTTATDSEILAWLPEGFEPDEMYQRDEFPHPADKVPVPAGYREVWLWFD